MQTEAEILSNKGAATYAERMNWLLLSSCLSQAGILFPVTGLALPTPGKPLLTGFTSHLGCETAAEHPRAGLGSQGEEWVQFWEGGQVSEARGAEPHHPFPGLGMRMLLHRGSSQLQKSP